jgi:hypothetical protein
MLAAMSTVRPTADGPRPATPERPGKRLPDKINGIDHAFIVTGGGRRTFGLQDAPLSQIILNGANNAVVDRQFGAEYDIKIT